MRFINAKSLWAPMASMSPPGRLAILPKLPYTTAFLDPNEVRKICSMLDLDIRGFEKEDYHEWDGIMECMVKKPKLSH